jgi:hypothetical protein
MWEYLTRTIGPVEGRTVSLFALDEYCPNSVLRVGNLLLFWKVRKNLNSYFSSKDLSGCNPNEL